MQIFGEVHNVMFCQWTHLSCMTHNPQCGFFAEAPKCLRRSNPRVEPVRWQAHWLGITYSPNCRQCKAVGHPGDPASDIKTSLVVPFGYFFGLSTCCTERLELRGSLVKASESCGTEFSVYRVLRLGKFTSNEQLTLKALERSCECR